MNFMDNVLVEDDELYALKKCIYGLFIENFFCDFKELFEEGEIYNPDAEEGIHVYSKEHNESYNCDFYFEGFRAHLITGQQCIVSYKTLAFYLNQACEWYECNNPELLCDVQHFRCKYLIGVSSTNGL